MEFGWWGGGFGIVLQRDVEQGEIEEVPVPRRSNYIRLKPCGVGLGWKHTEPLHYSAKTKNSRLLSSCGLCFYLPQEVS